MFKGVILIFKIVNYSIFYLDQEQTNIIVIEKIYQSYQKQETIRTDYSQSELLKLIRVYESTYQDCDGDRVVVKLLDVLIDKQDLDEFLRDINFKTPTKIIIFFINYLINYINLIKRALPYFIIMNTDDESPSFDNVTLYEDHDLNQIQLGEYRYNRQADKIVTIIKTNSKVILILIEKKESILIDFKIPKDQVQFYKQVKSFFIEFFDQNFKIKLDIRELCTDLDQNGDQGDFILYFLYKLFIAQQNKYELLQDSEIVDCKRKILWLLMKSVKKREKDDDIRENNRRLEQQMEAESQRRLLQQQTIKKQNIEAFYEKKRQILSQLQKVEAPKIIEIEDPKEKEYRDLLSQFNQTRPINKLESFITRKKPTQNVYEYAQIQERSNNLTKIVKDPKAKIKIPNYQYNIEKPPQISQYITPASYAIANLFNDQQPKFETPKIRKVIDYRISDYNELKRQRFQEMLLPSKLQQAGQNVFRDHYYSYEIPKQITYQEPKEQEKKQITQISGFDFVNQQLNKFLLE
ncbi:hypothetical protein pb186bvf_009049 [Paramecium bursaria]